jgi:hypothetical protein
MPKLHSLPAEGQMGFGSANVRIRGSNSLVIGEDEGGYSFSLRHYNHPAHPRWDVTATLWQVDWKGRNVRRITQAHRRLLTINREVDASLNFTLPKEPAVYRSTIEIRSLSGRKLGGFGTYYRVVRPTSHAQFRLNAGSYRPGSIVNGRVENLGTEPLVSGADYAIEKLEGATWIRAPESPHVFPAIAFIVPGGMSRNRCDSFFIPESMAVGRYRMSKRFRLATQKMKTEGGVWLRPVTRSAEFEIVR